MILECRDRKSVSLGRNQYADTASGDPGGEAGPASSSSEWLPQFLGLWLHHLNSAPIITSPSPVQISLCLVLKWTCVVIFRAHLDIQDGLPFQDL